MRILLPTDGSDYSKTAAGYVRDLGLRQGDELYVLHALKDFLLPDEVDPARDFIKAGQQGARRMLSEFTAENLHGMAGVKTIVREGEPWREISEAVAELKADLVVMGHRGLGLVSEYIIGGTTRKVVRHAGVSCLVVRNPMPHGRPVRALYCADGSVSAGHAREILEALPYPAGSEVDVLSVVDMDITTMPERYYPGEDISRMMAELREHYRAKAQKVVDSECAMLGKRFGKVTGQIRFGAPDDEIIKAAGELGADLVVMGCREMKGLADVIVGSESMRVLRHISANALIASGPGS